MSTQIRLQITLTASQNVLMNHIMKIYFKACVDSVCRQHAHVISDGHSTLMMSDQLCNKWTINDITDDVTNCSFIGKQVNCKYKEHDSA